MLTRYSVQADVANIQAWRSTVETIPSLLLAVPYGLLADKYSASKILALSGLGGVLAMMLDLFICMFLSWADNSVAN